MKDNQGTWNFPVCDLRYCRSLLIFSVQWYPIGVDEVSGLRENLGQIETD